MCAANKEPNPVADAEKVSVTWKYMAVTMVSVSILVIGYDRTEFAARLGKVEDAVRVAPTKQDITELRAAIDKLSDRIYAVKERNP